MVWLEAIQAYKTQNKCIQLPSPQLRSSRDREAISEDKQGFESMYYCLMQEAQQEVFSEQEWDSLMADGLLLDALLATAAAVA
jgi:hypothetical protein